MRQIKDSLLVESIGEVSVPNPPSTCRSCFLQAAQSRAIFFSKVVGSLDVICFHDEQHEPPCSGATGFQSTEWDSADTGAAGVELFGEGTYSGSRR